MDLVKALTEKYMKPELPEMNVGDTVRVTVRVKEGNRVRNQAFDGTIIAKKHGGINETITVRRISYGVGCEKVFPVHSPTIVSVETIRRGKVRRAKLYSGGAGAEKKGKARGRIGAVPPHPPLNPPALSRRAFAWSDTLILHFYSCLTGPETV